MTGLAVTGLTVTGLAVTRLAGVGLAVRGRNLVPDGPGLSAQRASRFGSSRATW